MAKNIKFPKEARQEGVTGTVVTKLMFDNTGNIKDFTIINGLGEDIDEEVTRHLKGAPAWDVIKAKESYEAIYPITFKIDNKPVGGPDFHSVLGKGLKVVGYGGQSKFQEPSARNNGILTIKVINDKLVNFNGKILSIDPSLEKAIQAILVENGLSPTEITAHLSAEPDVKMGAIHEVQNALRVNKLNRLLYTSSRLNDGRPKKSDLFTPLENQPLVILDGVINASIDDIDPRSIESISVLKDGNAVNLYGSAAKNGVIIVTSKK